MTERALTWSYGGGVQSIAIAILVAQGRLPRPERIVYADTGREASETWEYHERHTAPLLLETVGLTVDVAGHDLSTVDVYGKNGDLLVPAYTATGKLPTLCSTEWKKRVVRRYLRGLGYGPSKPVDSWMGFSLDEVERLKTSDVAWQRYRWPLCFDLKLTRADCAQLVRDFGWPEPPKSSCWMCPHRKNPQWRRLRDEYPADFAAAVAFDREIRANDQRGGVFLHFSGKPLEEADLGADEPGDDAPLFACMAGGCWT